jgi:hypothetical protein
MTTTVLTPGFVYQHPYSFVRALYWEADEGGAGPVPHVRTACAGSPPPREAGLDGTAATTQPYVGRSTCLSRGDATLVTHVHVLP